MENLNLSNFIAKYINYKPITPTSVNNKSPQNISANTSASASSANQTNFTSASSANIQMGSLSSADRSVYIKDLMKLPKNLNELMFMLQKNLNQIQFNRLFEQQMAARRNLLTQTQAQILAQLQGLSTTEINAMLKSQMNGQLANSLKNLQIAPNMLINIADISNLIQINGKDAITKLILAMTAASKNGVSDLTQLKDTAKLINASIALASTDNPAQILKTLMLLYLPWLPLHEGVGFDLDVETSSESGSDDESLLIITITTVNYGIVKAVVFLETSNSVQINIECDEKFPKDELMLRLQSEQKNYSMQSVISFDTKKSPENTPSPEVTNAKINMSHTTEISPYLLLAAHSIIRNTIELDRNPE